MKRIFHICILFLLLAVFSSCSGLSSPNPEQHLTQIKIGLMLYRQDDTFISLLQQSFESQAKALEAQDQIKIVVNVVDAKGNQGIQNEQVDQFLSQNYDVLCVNGVDRTAASVIIDKAKNADIPVVFFNREPVPEDLQRWKKVYYVGSLAQTIGDMQGKIILDAYLKDMQAVDRNQDEKLQYVMLEGEAGHQDSLIRTENSVKALTSAGVSVEKLANDTANWQRSQGSAKMSLWIETFGDQIEVVFCNNDDMALGAIDAYESAGIVELPLIVGADATPAALGAVMDQKLTGTVLNDYEGQAQAILQLAYSLATGVDPVKTIPGLTNRHYYVTPKIFTLREIDPEAAKQVEKEQTQNEAENADNDTPVFADLLSLKLQTNIFSSDLPIIRLQPTFHNQSEEEIALSLKRIVSLRSQQTVAATFYPQHILAGETQTLPPIFLEGLTEGDYHLEMTAQGLKNEEKINLSVAFSLQKDPQGIFASSDTLLLQLTILPVHNELSGFRQVLHNTSAQTIGLGREYSVELLEDGNWIPATYPAGIEPSWTEEYIFLSPGEQIVLEGILPFSTSKAPNGLRCRIIRNITVQQPKQEQQNQILLYSIWEK